MPPNTFGGHLRRRGRAPTASTSPVASSAVDDAGDLYVSDNLNEKVKKYTADGTFVARWTVGHRAGWARSSGIDVAADGGIYVADRRTCSGA